ncbi:hydroxysteroid dehydrogenase-like protein [Acrasis kona]|uniref:Hydroxysteroid dehydrogenase-like protein n=1 Tax=Acrasis kona TaxID=1008807 RepID=A0AAW2YUM7_9EUKA
MKTILLLGVTLIIALTSRLVQKQAIDDKDFKQRYGPWCVIAGGSDGLGEAYARQFAKRGINLVLISRTKEKLHNTSQAISLQYGVEVRALVGDLFNTRQVIQDLDDMTRDVEVGSLVYNAAYYSVGSYYNQTTNNIQDSIDICIKTPSLMVNSFLNSFKKRGSGGIMIVSSILGLFGTKKLPMYAAVKSFQTVLAKSIWDEAREYGVDVTSPVLGVTSTPASDKVRSLCSPFSEQTPEDAAYESVAHMYSRVGPVINAGWYNKVVSSVLHVMPSSISTQFVWPLILGSC